MKRIDSVQKELITNFEFGGSQIASFRDKKAAERELHERYRNQYFNIHFEYEYIPYGDHLVAAQVFEDQTCATKYGGKCGAMYGIRR